MTYINNVEYLNLPQQVEKNKKDIAAIEPTNLTQIEADIATNAADIATNAADIVVLQGITEPKEDDLRFPATGANKKKDTVVFDEDEIALLFPDDDDEAYIYMIAQMPHDREPDSDIDPHVHVRLEKAGQPVFLLEYKWYNIGEEVPGSWSTYTINVNTNIWSTGVLANIIMSTTPIDGTGKTSSSIMIMRLARLETDNYSGDLLFDEFDIHYVRSRLGENV